MPRTKSKPPVEECFIANPEAFTACLEHLQQTDRLAFDTEFIGEDRFRPHLCLIQVATDDVLYVIDPFTVGDLAPFWKLLVQPDREVIVHAAREEVRLCHQGCGRIPSRLVDLQVVAGLVGYNYPIGLGTLIRETLDIRVDKQETLTNWRHRPLSPAQIIYAFDDVRHLLPIWDLLHKQLVKHKRLPWLEEETKRLLVQCMRDPVVEERWRRLPGVNNLDRKKLAVLSALYAWREERAAQQDRPSKQVLRDDILVEIARRSPTKANDIRLLRGIGKGDTDSILELIVQAKSLPLSQCPMIENKEEDPPQVAILAQAMQLVLAEWSHREKVSGALAATAQELKQLVRQRLNPELAIPDTALLYSGWRKEFLYPILDRFLAGKLSLKAGKLTSDFPLILDD